MDAFTFYMFLGVMLLILISMYRHGLILYTVASYILLQGLINSFYPELLNQYFIGADIGPGLINLTIASLKSLVFSIVVFSFVMGMDKKYFVHFMVILCWGSLLNCVIIFWHVLHHKAASGLMLTSCMDGPLLAIMYPFMYSMQGRMKWVFRILPVVTIFITTSSVGIGALCVALVFMFMKNKKLLIIPGAIFGIAVVTNSHLFSDSYRFVCWAWSMKWWQLHASHIFGTGLGTYFPLGAYIQDTTKHLYVGTSGKITIYPFIHNDWLQCLFELGWIGLILIFGLFIECLRRTYRNPTLFASIMTFGATAVFVFPVRNIVTAVIGMFLVRLSLVEKETPI